MRLNTSRKRSMVPCVEQAPICDSARGHTDTLPKKPRPDVSSVLSAASERTVDNSAHSISSMQSMRVTRDSPSLDAGVQHQRKRQRVNEIVAQARYAAATSSAFALVVNSASLRDSIRRLIG